MAVTLTARAPAGVWVAWVLAWAAVVAPRCRRHDAGLHHGQQHVGRHAAGGAGAGRGPANTIQSSTTAMSITPAARQHKGQQRNQSYCAGGHLVNCCTMTVGASSGSAKQIPLVRLHASPRTWHGPCVWRCGVQQRAIHHHAAVAPDTPARRTRISQHASRCQANAAAALRRRARNARAFWLAATGRRVAVAVGAGWWCLAVSVVTVCSWSGGQVEAVETDRSRMALFR